MNHNIPLGTPIAERVLFSSKNQSKIFVRIGLPQETEHGDFLTPYQIIGMGDEKVRAAAGLDAVQSLQLVFRMIGADLASASIFEELKWSDADDCGFPAP